MRSPQTLQEKQETLTVYYDGACPLCRKEISYYQKKIADKDICWIDASDCDQNSLGSDLSRHQAMKRFHVRSTDGQLLSGASAFAAMWRVTPGFKWVGAFVQSRALNPFFELLYRMFLLIRPALQRITRLVAK